MLLAVHTLADFSRRHQKDVGDLSRRLKNCRQPKQTTATFVGDAIIIIVDRPGDRQLLGYCTRHSGQQRPPV